MKQIGWLAALLVLCASSARAQFNGVSATLKLDQDEYLPGEDVQLKVRVVNRSGEEIKLGSDNRWLAVSISQENNVPCPLLGEMPVQGEFTLESGEAGTRTVNPTPYYDFRQMGRYRVTATVHLTQWGDQVTCPPVYFTIGHGVPLPNLENIQFGVPVSSNGPPEVRAYSLLKVTRLKEESLYLRLTDAHGGILRVIPIARMMSFSNPEAQIDKLNNLHVLHQTGARTFNYSVISRDGLMIKRQTYDYAATRPVLRLTVDGEIFVAGGQRVSSPTDFPPAGSESARQ